MTKRHFALMMAAVALQSAIGAILFAQVTAEITVKEGFDKELRDSVESSNSRFAAHSLSFNDISESDGFVPLFDGKTLEGWTQRGGKAKYAVEDGMIVGATAANTSNSFLCTDKTYGDFMVEVDFKVDPELNSGVQVRSECFDKPTTVKSGDKEIKIPAGRVHGYQCEIDMDAKKARWWTAGIYDEGRRGWLYPGALGGDAKTFTDQGAKLAKQNEWNRLRIEAVGDTIKTWLNGEPRAEIKDSMTPKGFIALQVHGVGGRQEPLHVYWKNIRIKEINPKPAE